MFHSALDGKGRRDVIINGIRVQNVIWANEEKGLICLHPTPLRQNKRKGEVYTMLLRGKVVVSHVDD